MQLSKIVLSIAVETLQGAVPIASIMSLVITHLTPRRIDSLKAFLNLRVVPPDMPKLEVHLSNPALQSLRSILSTPPPWAPLLPSVILSIPCFPKLKVL